MYAPRDVRVEERADPVIEAPTDAVIRVTAACICGSDLWPYRGTDAVTEPTPMGHEYVGVVEQVGEDVSKVKVGDYVVGSFFASDNTCEICRAGYQSRCVHAFPMGAIGTQAEKLRVPLADGTLVIVPGAGAEIYRGLGAVIVGGILVSHVFTLVLMPAMLRLGEKPMALKQAPMTPARQAA